MSAAEKHIGDSRPNFKIENRDPVTPHVHLHGDLFTGGFFTDPIDTFRVLSLAHLGQSVMATPRGLGALWGITPRTVGKHVLRLRPLVKIQGEGYVRTLVIHSLITCAVSNGTTPELAMPVACGYKMPEGPVSHWRVNSISPALRRKILARDGERCRYCGACDGPFHIDHITPVASGGSDAPSNLCVACAPCNLSKGGKSLAQWAGTK